MRRRAPSFPLGNPFPFSVDQPALARGKIADPSRPSSTNCKEFVKNCWNSWRLHEPGPRGEPPKATQRKGAIMGIGTSILLIAVGAILRFAVSVHDKVGSVSVNWHIVGDVLMVVGAIGLVFSLLYMTMWSRGSARTTVVDDSAPVRRERVIDDRYEAP
jgi:hypothetical protein